MPKLFERVSEWFELEGDPMGGRVKIHYLEPYEISAITGKCTRTINRLTPEGKVERVQEIDIELDKQETCVMAIADWENFVDADGKKLECNRLNKALWAGDPWFMGQIAKFRRQLTARVKEQREAAEKN